jgi:hypothetical protein
VRIYTASPERFAEYFNKRMPGAYRQIGAQDVRDMTECGLVKRYGSYGNTDIQIVIGVLNYEQLLEKRKQKAIRLEQSQPHHCRLCGEPLPTEPEGKKGRPREYCDACESKRAKDRNRTWRKRRLAVFEAGESRRLKESNRSSVGRA